MTALSVVAAAVVFSCELIEVVDMLGGGLHFYLYISKFFRICSVQGAVFILLCKLFVVDLL